MSCLHYSFVRRHVQASLLICTTALLGCESNPGSMTSSREALVDGHHDGIQNRPSSHDHAYAQHSLNEPIQASQGAFSAVSAVMTFAPQWAQKKQLRDTLDYLRQSHVEPFVIDTAYIKRVMTLFWQQLDPNQLFLGFDERREFEPTLAQLQQEIEQNRLDWAFSLYSEYHQRQIRYYTWLLQNPELKQNKQWEELLPDEQSRLTNLRAFHQPVLTDQTGRPLGSESYPLAATNLYRQLLNELKARDAWHALGPFLQAVIQAHDAQSRYVPPQPSLFTAADRTKHAGVGLLYQAKQHQFTLLEVVPGSPAEGVLLPGDQLLAVGPDTHSLFDVRGQSNEVVVNRLRGKAGSTVVIKVGRGQSPMKIVTTTLTRALIQRERQAIQYALFDSKRFAQPLVWIKIKEFPQVRDPIPGAAKDQNSVSAILSRLCQTFKQQGVGGYLLDLRDNRIGELRSALRVAGLFMHRSILLQVKERNKPTKYFATDHDKPQCGAPLVVLVNRDSVGASEAVAAILQDGRRGIVVGSNTFGFGNIQAIKRLRHGRVKLTTARYYRATGDSIHERGVTPAVFVGEIKSRHNDSRRKAFATIKSIDAIEIVPFIEDAVYDDGERRLRVMHRQRAQPLNITTNVSHPTNVYDEDVALRDGLAILNDWVSMQPQMQPK